MNLNSQAIKKIKEIRNNLDYNQREFAKLINVSDSVYSRVENGEKELTLSFIEHIAAATKTDISEILEIKSSNYYNQERGIQQNGTNLTLTLNLSKDDLEEIKKVFK